MNTIDILTIAGSDVIWDWKGWAIVYNPPTDQLDLYDPYGTYVASAYTATELARKAAQIDEAW